MRSKAYHAFTQKLSYFDDDIELMDVLYRSVTNGDLTDQASQYILKRVDPVQHTHLARRKNSDGSRSIVITHLRSTIYAAYVKDIYEEVTHYLRTVLAQASKNGFNSSRLVGEHSFKVDAKSILALGDWNKVCQAITDSIFQSLEAEKSTLKLLEKMASKLALNIDAALITAALPYLEARHFLVHTDGKPSDEYVAAYPQIQVKAGYIALNFVFISNLRSTVRALIAEYDKEVIKGNLLKADDTQP
jgi:hypothetical protein